MPTAAANKSLRKLELRFLDAGIIVARTSDDLIRYHGKYILIDRRVLYVLSFNFTHLDIDHSRGFGIVTTNANWVREAARLFRADCTRTKYAPKTDTFVVSPANSRKVLGTFLKRAKTQLLIYDPKISDKEMLRILQERAKAGVEIKVIGSVAGARPVRRAEAGRHDGCTRARSSATGARRSSAARACARAELDSRRELGLIVQDAKAVKTLIETFESDWAGDERQEGAGAATRGRRTSRARRPGRAVSDKEAEKAVQVFTKELDPLAVSVKKAVRKAVAKAGEDVLHDKDVKDTMKKVVKKAVKEAVKEAVQDAQDAQDVKEARNQQSRRTCVHAKEVAIQAAAWRANSRSNTTVCASRFGLAVLRASVHEEECAAGAPSAPVHHSFWMRAGSGRVKPRRSSISANVRTTVFAYRSSRYLYSALYRPAAANRNGLGACPRRRLGAIARDRPEPASSIPSSAAPDRSCAEGQSVDPLRDDGFGRQQQRRDRRGVLQRGPDHLGRIDDAGLRPGPRTSRSGR